MRLIYAAVAVFAFAGTVLADWVKTAEGFAWKKPGTPPAESVEYNPAKYTQAIFRLDERPTVRMVPIKDLEDKWHRSGGFSADIKFTSRKFHSGGDPKYSVALIPVKNSFGYMQNEQGLTRVYPDGARFDDVLSNAEGVVFEHRVREKADGKWKSRIEYKDIEARPKGYEGLTVSCASCHNQAGTGEYGVGLVPGGDTVLSVPMDWKFVSQSLADYK